MRVILSAVGRAFVRDFVVAFFALASGILAAPNYQQAAALAGAASLAALVAAVRGVRVYVPGLSVAIGNALHLPAAYGEVVVTGVTTVLVGFIALAEGAFSAPDLDAGKAIAVAGLLGIGTALVRIVQAFLTPGEPGAGGGGIQVPPQPVPVAALPPVAPTT